MEEYNSVDTVDKYETMLREMKNMIESVNEYKKLDFKAMKCIEVLSEYKYDLSNIVSEIIRLRDIVAEPTMCDSCGEDLDE